MKVSYLKQSIICGASALFLLGSGVLAVQDTRTTQDQRYTQQDQRQGDFASSQNLMRLKQLEGQWDVTYKVYHSDSPDRGANQPLATEERDIDNRDIEDDDLDRDDTDQPGRTGDQQNDPNRPGVGQSDTRTVHSGQAMKEYTGNASRSWVLNEKFLQEAVTINMPDDPDRPGSTNIRDNNTRDEGVDPAGGAVVEYPDRGTRGGTDIANATALGLFGYDASRNQFSHVMADGKKGELILSFGEYNPTTQTFTFRTHYGADASSSQQWRNTDQNRGTASQQLTQQQLQQRLETSLTQCGLTETQARVAARDLSVRLQPQTMSEQEMEQQIQQVLVRNGVEETKARTEARKVVTSISSTAGQGNTHQDQTQQQVNRQQLQQTLTTAFTDCGLTEAQARVAATDLSARLQPTMSEQEMEQQITLILQRNGVEATKARMEARKVVDRVSTSSGFERDALDRDDDLDEMIGDDDRALKEFEERRIREAAAGQDQDRFGDTGYGASSSAEPVVTLRIIDNNKHVVTMNKPAENGIGWDRYEITYTRKGTGATPGLDQDRDRDAIDRDDNNRIGDDGGQ